MTTSIALGVGEKEPVTLLPSRANGDVTLVVGDVAEVRLERVHLEELRDQIPGALDVLALVDADEAACAGALGAARRAVKAADIGVAAALVAERSGDVERAAELRAAAEQATATVRAVDAAISAVDGAALAADSAAEYAVNLAVGRAPGGVQDAV